jgi:hypothetical protein
MKNRYCKHDPVEVLLEKSPFHAASMSRASHIIQDTYCPIIRQVFEQFVNQSERVVLSFSRGSHVDKPKYSIVTAQHSHQGGGVEELTAGFLSGFVCCREARLATIEYRIGNF